MIFIIPRFPVIALAMILFPSALEIQAQDCRLQFNDDLSFKIAQFADTHFFKDGARSYSLAKDRGIGGYGWFDKSQIRWFAEKNQAWLAKYPEVQSLLFFHIPLPEYGQAFDHG